MYMNILIKIKKYNSHCFDQSIDVIWIFTEPICNSFYYCEWVSNIPLSHTPEIWQYADLLEVTLCTCNLNSWISNGVSHYDVITSSEAHTKTKKSNSLILKNVFHLFAVNCDTSYHRRCFLIFSPTAVIYSHLFQWKTSKSVPLMVKRSTC